VKGMLTNFRLTACLDRVSDLSSMARAYGPEANRTVCLLVWDVRDTVDEAALLVSTGQTGAAREVARALCHDIGASV
jgi:hypothetical protein